MAVPKPSQSPAVTALPEGEPRVWYVREPRIKYAGRDGFCRPCFFSAYSPKTTDC